MSATLSDVISWPQSFTRPNRPSLLEESELLRRAGPGREPQMFAELVRRHQSKVRGLLLRLTCNSALADDLGQEVFLRAYRGLENFEGRAKFATWLYRIAYNVFLNHRSRSRVLVALPAEFESRTAQPASSGSSPARVDLRRDLDSAIAALPDAYRAVVVLYYVEEISYPEIAEILQCPLGTVKTHLHRAKKLLRQNLVCWEGRGIHVD